MLESKKPRKKSGAQRLLEGIEDKLRELIREKKELWKEFIEKDKELEALRKRYKKDFEEAEKIKNQLILLWDYYSRQVEILRLGKKIQETVLPSEQKELTQKQLKLMEYNETLEKGFKERKIDAEVLDEIKKRLGVWEDDE